MASTLVNEVLTANEGKVIELRTLCKCRFPTKKYRTCGIRTHQGYVLQGKVWPICEYHVGRWESLNV